MIERKWLAVTATPLIADGSAIGIVTVADTAGFYTKQSVYLASSTIPAKQFQVQEVISPTQLVLGPPNPSKVGRENFADVSAYLALDGAALAAPEQDKKANPPDKDHYSAIYASDPIVADRVIFVDQYGKYYGEGNPLPIAFDGTISIGNVEIHYGDNVLKVNSDGSINVTIVPSTDTTDAQVINRYGEANAVISGATTQIASYTVPMGKVSILQKVECSGENVAKFQVLVNGVAQATQRTYWGSGFNLLFDFTTGQDNGFVLAAGDVVSVTVLYNRPYVGDFEARIQIYQVTLS